MVAGISRNLGRFLKFLGAEVVLEALDLLLVAGGDLGQHANDRVGVPLHGVELETEKCFI